MNTRGEVGEAVVHDPRYPLFVTDERAPYCIYDTQEAMIDRSPRNCRRARITRSEDGRVVTASLIDISTEPPVISQGLTLMDVPDIVAYELLLSNQTSLKERGHA